MVANKYTYAVGKRKTAIAKVRLFSGQGDVKINGIAVSDYVKRVDLFGLLYQPFKVTGMQDRYYFEVSVVGSGESSQVQAIRHGISRALVKDNSALKKVLKENGLIMRDARIVERKKPGLHKARKGPQWSKR